VGRTALIVLAVALLVGSAAAFTRTERLKLAASPVAKPQFERHLSPACDCPHSVVQLSLLLRRPETLDVSVVDSDGDHVATLAEGDDAEAGRVSFEWDGRNDDGDVVPDGLYRLKLRLEHDRRTILIPKTVLVDTAPPRVRVLRAVAGPDGIAVRYRTNEGARVSLLRNGKKVAHGGRRSGGAGRLLMNSMGIPDPLNGFTLVAVDRAGNRAAPLPVDVVLGTP
jgi:flagellar hook capping protein FlgD